MSEQQKKTVLNRLAETLWRIFKEIQELVDYYNLIEEADRLEEDVVLVKRLRIILRKVDNELNIIHARERMLKNGG